MALLRYLKPANGLPDLKGSLSTMISPHIIAKMNKEEASRCVAGGKHGPYKTYTSSEHSQDSHFHVYHSATVCFTTLIA